MRFTLILAATFAVAPAAFAMQATASGTQATDISASSHKKKAKKAAAKPKEDT